MDPLDTYLLCLDCARNVWARGPQPGPDYVERVARLLFGTWAIESGGGRWDRQRRFSLAQLTGGWGWWQIEYGSVETSLAALARWPALAKRSAVWLFERADADPGWYRDMKPLAIMQWMRLTPRLGLLFARLHYLRHPSPIPASLAAQAKYYKDVYNTYVGKGTRQKYMDDWVLFCEPVMKRLEQETVV